MGLEVFSSGIEAQRWCKKEVYNKIENNAGNAYLHNTTAKTAGQK